MYYVCTPLQGAAAQGDARLLRRGVGPILAPADVPQFACYRHRQVALARAAIPVRVSRRSAVLRARWNLGCVPARRVPTRGSARVSLYGVHFRNRIQ